MELWHVLLTFVGLVGVLYANVLKAQVS